MFLAELCPRTWRHGAHRGASLKGLPHQPRVFRFATHYLVCIPRGLDSKGGGRSPRPLCRFKGVRGEIEIPPRFSLGGAGGDILF